MGLEMKIGFGHEVEQEKKPKHKPCRKLRVEINGEYYVEVDDNNKWKPILDAIENHLEDEYCNECRDTVDGMSMRFKLIKDKKID